MFKIVILICAVGAPVCDDNHARSRLVAPVVEEDAAHCGFVGQGYLASAASLVGHDETIRIECLPTKTGTDGELQ